MTEARDIVLPTASNPVVTIDGDLRETMRAVDAMAEAAGVTCLGICAVTDYETAMWQHLPDVLSVEDIDDIADRRTHGLVLIGPTALLGAATAGLVARIHDALPGVGIVCATGVRTDLPRD